LPQRRERCAANNIPRSKCRSNTIVGAMISSQWPVPMKPTKFVGVISWVFDVRRRA
jgi:hypothetical protein